MVAEKMKRMRENENLLKVERKRNRFYEEEGKSSLVEGG